MRYGNLDVRLEDVPFLRELQQSSWKVAGEIGAPEKPTP